MRILFLSDRYPPHYLGGYEIACSTVAEQLQRRGHEVSILTSTFGLNSSGSVHRNVFRLLHYGWKASNLIQLAWQEVRDHRTVRKVISSTKPDIIYAWSLFQLFPSLHLALRAAGIPVVFNLQDVWLSRQLAGAEQLRSPWLRPDTNLGKRVGKTFFRKAWRLLNPTWLQPLSAGDLLLGNLIFCSRFQLAEHERLGLPLGNFRVIYNGIDSRLFSGAPNRYTGGPLRALFVGRLVEEKGAHIALEALAQLQRSGYREVMLSIAGVPCYPWNYEPKLQQIVHQEGLGGCVQFLGMVPHDALPEVYRQHHVLVFPSAHNEGLPMTLVEAMASGLAVVGTTTGGTEEIVQPQFNGLAFAPGDAAGLAGCLRLLLQDPMLCRSLAAAGQQLVRTRFDIAQVAVETESGLHEALESRLGGGQSARPLCEAGQPAR